MILFLEISIKKQLFLAYFTIKACSYLCSSSANPPVCLLTKLDEALILYKKKSGGSSSLVRSYSDGITFLLRKRSRYTNGFLYVQPFFHSEQPYAVLPFIIVPFPQRGHIVGTLSAFVR